MIHQKSAKTEDVFSHLTFVVYGIVVLTFEVFSFA